MNLEETARALSLLLEYFPGPSGPFRPRKETISAWHHKLKSREVYDVMQGIDKLTNDERRSMPNITEVLAAADESKRRRVTYVQAPFDASLLTDGAPEGTGNIDEHLDSIDGRPSLSEEGERMRRQILDLFKHVGRGSGKKSGMKKVEFAPPSPKI